jgi:hypothetical protein
MPRLIDLLKKQPEIIPHELRHSSEQSQRAWWQIRQSCKSAVVLEVSNVCEYLYAADVRENWDLKEHFPNIAPLFPITFVEMRRPSRIVSEVHGIQKPPSFMPSRWGFLIEAADLKQQLYSPDEIPVVQELVQQGSITSDDISKIRWGITAFSVWEDESGEAISILIPITFLIDENGRCMSGPNFVQLNPIISQEERQRFSDMCEILPSMMWPAWLAICFAHCQKVKLIDQKPPEKVQKKRLLKGKEPLTTYHTLVIEPLEEILRTQGKAESNGLQRALTLCRGHFKTYTEESRLFGQHTGTWFWSSYIRNKESKRIREKDYALGNVPSDATLPDDLTE